MSQQLADFVTALHDVERACTEMRLAELNLADDETSVVAVNKAQDDIAHASRRLTKAVDDLPRNRQPKGWGTS